jgi:hypothetical protein
LSWGRREGKGGWQGVQQGGYGLTVKQQVVLG